MPITREEQLETVRSESSLAIGGGIDIHEWMARAIPFIQSHTDRFRFTEAVREVASRGRTSPLHKERVVLIRSILALASAAEPEVIAAPIMLPPQSISVGAQLPAIKLEEIAALSDDKGILWFCHHCHYRVKWSLIAWSASAVLAVFGAGFAAGRTNLFVRLFDVFHDTSATAPAHQPAIEPTANANNPAQAK